MLIDGFDFVKPPGVVVLDAYQNLIVRPTQFELGRQCLPNS